MAARGCGYRKQGAVYLMTYVGKKGRPIEDFLLDPPLVLDLAALGVDHIGVKLIERNGVWHVIDWVGASHYPNVADFVEETRLLGVSRHVSRNLKGPNGESAFELLTPQSTMIFLHDRAMIDNAADYYECAEDYYERAERVAFGTYLTSEGLHRPHCPKHLHEHEAWDTDCPMCARLWWQDIDGDVSESDSEEGLIERSLACGATYKGFRKPDGALGFDARYRPAAFMWMPIHGIEVVRDDDGAHEPTLDRITASAVLPVKLAEE